MSFWKDVLIGALQGLMPTSNSGYVDRPDLDPVKIQIMEPGNLQWQTVGTSVPNINAVSVRLREEVSKVPGRRARALDSNGHVVDIA